MYLGQGPALPRTVEAIAGPAPDQGLGVVPQEGDGDLLDHHHLIILDRVQGLGLGLGLGLVLVPHADEGDLVPDPDLPSSPLFVHLDEVHLLLNLHFCMYACQIT